MGEAAQVLVFSLERQQFALPLVAARRVVRSVQVTPVPNAPDILSGVIDVHGEIIPVLDIRGRLGQPRRAVALTDQFLIARMGERAVALVIDQAEGLAQVDQDSVSPCPEGSWFDGFQGVAQLEGGLVLIHDPDKFLSSVEAQALERVLESTR